MIVHPIRFAHSAGGALYCTAVARNAVEQTSHIPPRAMATPVDGNNSTSNAPNCRCSDAMLRQYRFASERFAAWKWPWRSIWPGSGRVVGPSESAVGRQPVRGHFGNVDGRVKGQISEAVSRRVRAQPMRARARASTANASTWKTIHSTQRACGRSRETMRKRG
jgi:hypothetical protein